MDKPRVQLTPASLPACREDGAILLFAMIMTLIASAAITTFMIASGADLRLTHRHNDFKRAMVVAESGLDRAIIGLRDLVIETGAPLQTELNTIQPPVFAGFQFKAPDGNAAYSVLIDGDFRSQLPILEGRWRGLSGDSQRYKIRVGVTDTHGVGGVLTHTFQRVTIPVFQFAIFYNGDLEILPGPSMTVSGPVHTNGNLYLGGDNTLQLSDLVTCAKHIYRHRKDEPATYQTGSTYIMNGAGVYVDMALGGGKYLDSDTPDWSVRAIETWDGRLIDQAHMVPTLSLPIPSSEQPHAIIERADATKPQTLEDQKFENKADIKIWRDVGGVLHATLADGSAFPLTYTIPGSTTTGSVNYAVTALNYYREVKFAGANPLLAQGGAKNTDTFVMTVTSGTTSVTVITCANGVTQTNTLSSGGYVVNAQGFKITFVSKVSNVYTFTVANSSAANPLTYVAFDFLGSAKVTAPAGSTTYAAPRTTVVADQPMSIATTTTFGDYREGNGVAKTMQSVDIDINALIRQPKFPGNGVIVYVYTDYQPTGTTGVIRIWNGAELPVGGLTVSSRNPIYVWGDYNTVNGAKPALVCGDAVSILSNNWTDANSWNALTSRVPTATTINTVIMTGNTDTAVGDYNGGLENVLRLKEKWSQSIPLTYRGSIVCLWKSTIATGPWVYGNNRYEAPFRDWGYDPMYRDPRNAPPGIPHVFGLEALTWKQDAWTAAERY